MAGAALAGNLARWSLEQPDAVRAVHRAYVEAGAQLLTTNTLLAAFEPDAAEIVRAGVALAREAPPHLPVAVSLGPGAPPGTYRALAEAAAEAGADLIQLETFTHGVELAAAVAATGGGLPVVALLVPADGARTLGDGMPVYEAMGRARGAGAALVGLNCAPPDVMAEAVGPLPEDFPLMLRPSAGMPRAGGETLAYDWLPAAWADAVYSFGERHCCLLGGCCGAGPRHLRALAARLSTAPAVASGRSAHA